MLKISIIVPVYKIEKYVRECIDSILVQTYQDWELLLIDDGSPDNSGVICDEYAQKDSRIRVYHKENGGVSSARNLGLEKMTGEWVMFVDADDTIKPNTLDLCINKCIDNNLDIIQFSFSRGLNDSFCHSDQTEPLTSEEYIRADKLLMSVWGSLIRSSIIIENNIYFDKTLKLAEDQIMIMDCIRNAQRLQRIPNQLYYYRDNSTGASQNPKYEDILLSSEKLIVYSVKYPVCISRCIAMVYVFLEKILRSGKCDKAIALHIYDKIKHVPYTGPIKLIKLFSLIAKVSPSFAYYLSLIIVKVK